MWSWQNQMTFTFKTTAQIKAVWWEQSVWPPHMKNIKRYQRGNNRWNMKTEQAFFFVYVKMLQQTLQIYDIVLSGLSIVCLLLLKASGHQIKLNSKQHLTLNNPSSVLKNYNGDHLWTTKDAFLCETFVKPLLCSIQLCTYKHRRWNLTFIKLLRNQMQVSSLYVIFEEHIVFQCKYPLMACSKHIIR